MSDDDAFLAAMAAPGDPLPRLVSAGWLDGHADRGPSRCGWKSNSPPDRRTTRT